MRINNNNNTAFGAVKVFPNLSRNLTGARLSVFCDMPAPPKVIGDTFESGIYLFHDLETQRAYIEKLRKDIPFIASNHVITDMPEAEIESKISRTFDNLMMHVNLY